MTVTGALAIPLRPAIAGGGHRDRCASPDSATRASNSRVRVFVKTSLSPKRGNYYICSRRSGRKTRIGANRGSVSTALRRFRLNGDLVAYEQTRTEEDFSEEGSGQRTVVLRSARSGRTLRSLPALVVRGAAFAEAEPDDGVRDLVVSAMGDLAWIVRNPNAIKPPEPNVNTSSRSTEVYTAPRGSAPTLLDQSDAIRQTSLRRRGCTISWLHGPTSRSGRVCP